MATPPIWVILILLAALVAIFFLYYVIITWTIADARARGQTGCLPPALFWLGGPLAILIWFLIRPKEKMIAKQPESYSNPDDALYSATYLDSEGEWDKAIALYQRVAILWPEHEPYCRESIKQIENKKSAS
jgi:hypothetical protein